MSTINIYKPRYKITWQSKSKVWPYKNSRLRRFFNIRGRKLVRRGLFKRVVLVFNNMKWTIARRFIRPYMKKRRPLRRRFKNVLYSKQQLRAFYGKEKESIFRNFFKRFLGGAKNRNNMFITALERRTDIILFRLRFLPTIYACRQFILHYGLTVNRRLEKSPSAQVLPGDIITFKRKHWIPFVEYLYERIYWRAYGLDVWKKRQFKMLRKKAWWCYRNKPFQKGNVALLRKQRVYLRHFFKSVKNFQSYFPRFFKKSKNLIKYIQKRNFILKDLTEEERVIYLQVLNLEKTCKSLWFDFKIKLRIFLTQIAKIQKKAWFLRFWKLRSYYTKFLELINIIFKSYKFLLFYYKQFRLIENNFYSFIFKFILQSKVKNIFKDTTALISELKNLSSVKKNLRLKLNLNDVELCLVQDKMRNINENIKQIEHKNYECILNGLLTKSFESNLDFELELKIFKKDFLALKNREMDLYLKQKNNKKLLEEAENKYNDRLNYYKCFKQISTQDILNKKEFKNYSEITLNDYKELKNNDKGIGLKNVTALEFMQQKIKEITLIKRILKTNFENLNDNSYDYLKSNIKALTTELLKNRIKRYTVKARSVYDPITKKLIYRRSPVLYFLMTRKFKAKRRQSIQRFRSVHWYIPSYIYFDFRTLRAVYLYNPKPEEVVYSFKCSLAQIHSFYRTLGY